MSAATGASAIEKNEASAEAQEENLTEVVDRYSPLVKRIAHHLLLRMPASVRTLAGIRNSKWWAIRFTSGE